MLEAHKQFGKLSLEEILKPVIKQAKEEGIEVTYDFYKAVDNTPRLKSDDESRNISLKDNKPLEENSIFIVPGLANTISLIAKNGRDGFYKGETAEKISYCNEK